jgi:hypothetical protein
MREVPMLKYCTKFAGRALGLAVATWFGVTGCSSDEAPTEVSGSEAAMVSAADGTSFGPFPGGTTIFVDVDNTTGFENGTREHPFNTLWEGIAQSGGGAVIGLAPGVYTRSFEPGTPNYVIAGRKDFKLLGSGASRTIIRGDHSFSLIRVQNGSTGIIKDLTIEHGGQNRHSEGGGIQVIGSTAPVDLTVQNVILQDNRAVNGGGISAEGSATVRLINVVVANNHADNSCGGVYLLGANGDVKGVIRNSTVTQNSANFSTGGVCVNNGARLNLVNSIVWGNSLAEVGQPWDGVATVSYSDVGEATFPGPGNIRAFPRFVDPANRDYRLRSTSPAVDAGTNTGAPRMDIRGVTRPNDGDGDGTAVTDMGAYEFGKIF